MIDIKTTNDMETLRQVALLLEAEVQRLIRRIQVLTKELAEAKGENTDRLQLELALVQEQLDRRMNDLYGKSSEKRSSNSSPENKDSPVSKPDKEKQRGHGPREQMNLPVVEKEHELDEPDKICPKCGGDLDKLAGQYEESEEIDIVHREYRIIRHKRQKYVCRCGACVETALGQRKLMEGGRYSVNFAVDVAVSKYADHMPLTRQVTQMERFGLYVEAQTLWDQLWAMHRRLMPTYEALHKYVLFQPVIGADETTWPVTTKKGDSRDWWAWSVTCPDSVFYRIMANRNVKCAEAVLTGYGGVVMADGYSAYSALLKGISQLKLGEDPPIKFELANCWAHVRRKFIDCEEAYPQAKEAIDIIGELYEVEKRAKDITVGQDESARLYTLARMRNEESKKIVDKFYEWVARQAALPKSGLGIALEYAVNLKTGLMKFLENPQIPLDNNHTEREMRPLAVGRKNHYGSKSFRGTQVAALFYSLIESAKMNKLNPSEYLTEALNRAIDNPGTVTLPADYAKEKTADQS